jgi:hypothetical protein
VGRFVRALLQWVEGSQFPVVCCWSCVSISWLIVFERGFLVFSEDFDKVDYDVDDEVLECGLENPDICESCQ